MSRCPKCGHDDFYPDGFLRVFALTFVLGLGGFFALWSFLYG